jgi:hypothetical protein
MLAEILETVRLLARRSEQSGPSGGSSPVAAQKGIDHVVIVSPEDAKRPFLRARRVEFGGKVAADPEALNVLRDHGAEAVAAIEGLNAQFTEAAKVAEAMQAQFAKQARAVAGLGQAYADAERVAATLDALQRPIADAVKLAAQLDAVADPIQPKRDKGTS